MIHDTPVIFHPVPAARVVLQQSGVLSVAEVYAYGENQELFAKKGSGFIRLYKSKLTGKKGVTAVEFVMPFEPSHTKLGYLALPTDYIWQNKE